MVEWVKGNQRKEVGKEIKYKDVSLHVWTRGSLIFHTQLRCDSIRTTAPPVGGGVTFIKLQFPKIRISLSVCVSRPSRTTCSRRRIIWDLRSKRIRMKSVAGRWVLRS